MAMKSTLCLFDGGDEEMSALATAAAYTAAVRGRLEALHVTYLSSVFRGPHAEAAVAGGGWVEVIDRQRDRITDAARALAEATAERYGLPLGGEALPAVHFTVLENASNADVVRTLALSDLVVVGAATGSTDVIDRTPVDLALFTARRPVLVVRPTEDDAPAPILGARTAVAWDGSVVAIHALVATTPLLAGQRSVTLITAGGGARRDPAPALAYLAAHGITAHADPVDGDRAAVAVLRRAREIGAGLLVSGAYGHSVVRERVLGGFTDTLLSEAEMPLLLVH